MIWPVYVDSIRSTYRLCKYYELACISGHNSHYATTVRNVWRYQRGNQKP